MGLPAGWRAWVYIVFSRRWGRVVTSGVITGSIFVLTAVATVLSAAFSAPIWLTIGCAILCLLWAFGAIFIASYQAWRDERVERNAANAALHEALRPPPIHGTVSAFEILDATKLSEDAWAELREIKGTTSVWCFARLEIDNPGNATRALDWRFSIKNHEGGVLPCEPVVKTWNVPPEWPRVEYKALDVVQAEYFDARHVTIVVLNVPLPASPTALDLHSFEVSFRTSEGKEVVCHE